jgi:hypothetical protein
MDAIKYLVSGADPVGREADVPDGEKILQDILSTPEVFMDRVPVHVPTLAERRQRRGKVAGLLAVAAAAVTAGVLLTTNLGPALEAPAPAATYSTEPAPVTSASPSSTPAPAATAAPSQSANPATPTAAPPVAPADEWRSYTSADGSVSFEYPPDWTVLPKPSHPQYPAILLDVQDAAGKPVAFLKYGVSGGLGGACGAPVAYTVLDSVELALPYNASLPNVITPRFAFRALLEPDRVTASYGITSTTAGKDGLSCMFYNVVNGPPESPTYAFADVVQVRVGDGMTFSSLDEARAYMLTPEYINAKRMITSLKIQSGP